MKSSKGGKENRTSKKESTKMRFIVFTTATTMTEHKKESHRQTEKRAQRCECFDGKLCGSTWEWCVAVKVAREVKPHGEQRSGRRKYLTGLQERLNQR